MIAASYWEVVGYVLLVIGIAAVFVFATLAWIYVAEEGGPLAVVVAVVASVSFVLLLAWVFTLIDGSDQGDRAECEQAGGYWEQTGTRPVLVGKVIVMQPVYGCVFRAG